MNVLQKDNGKKGEFYIEVTGKQDTLMTYTWAGTDKIIIDHTEVNESLRGQGVGYELVEAAVDFLRKKSLKVIPLCPFAKSVFDKTSDYNDVLI